MRLAIILKLVVSAALSLAALLAVCWGVFCFSGGPDPGAASGREGLKFGTTFVLVGLGLLWAAAAVWTKVK